MKKSLKVLSAAAFAGMMSMMLLPGVGKAAAPSVTVADLPGGDGSYADTTEEGNNGTYVTVKVPKESVVKYGTKETRLSDTQKDSTEGDNDVYQISIPAKMIKSGGTKYVTATKNGETTKVSFEFGKAAVTASKQAITCKASLDTTDKNCEYGKIKVKENDKDLKEYSLYTADGMLDLDVTESTTANDWNAALKPLLREGATVYAYGEGWEDSNYNSGYPETKAFKHKWTYYDTKYTETAGKYTFDTKAEAVSYTYKFAKLKIAKQKAAPKIKVDAVKGTLSTSAKMEFKYKVSGGAVVNTWADAKKTMKITDVTKASIVANGLELNIRVKGTEKAAPSVYATVVIPDRKTIETAKITMTGPVTNAALKASDVDSTKNPYEYTTETPSATTKWKALTSKGVTFTKKTALTATSKVYVRQKGVNANAKKQVELKMPSTIAVVSPSGATWDVSAYTMPAFDGQ